MLVVRRHAATATLRVMVRTLRVRHCVALLTQALLLGCVRGPLPARLPAASERPVDATPLPPPTCPVDPSQWLWVERGTAPFIVTAAHSGSDRPTGCDPGSDVEREVGERACRDELDALCVSGPCVAGGPDAYSRDLVFAFVDELASCLGARPSLVLTEVRRSVIDANRDAYDASGEPCAFDDPAALPHWEAFHAAIEELVAEAVAYNDARALVLDLHTYRSRAAAPPPAVVLGAGLPFGVTLPHRAAADGTLDAIFGDAGLRRRLLESLAPIDPAVAVYPAAVDAASEELFNGRYLVHRYARLAGPDGPVIDALQIEVSLGVCEHTAEASRALAEAVCASIAP